MRNAWVVGWVVFAVGCFPNIGGGGGPYGNGCPAEDPGYTYCGLCSKTKLCHYCEDATGVCSDACTCVARSGGGGSGGAGGGGSGGSGGGGSTNGTDTNGCPAGSSLQCSQWVQNGNCSIQSCTCYNDSPTAYCGSYYRTSDGAFFWCGGGYNRTCSIGIEACATRVANYCTPH
jgi:hypothetical protein